MSSPEPAVGECAVQAEGQRGDDGDDEDPGTGVHVRLNKPVSETLPVSQPPANGGRNSTVAPGATITDSGSPVVTGRSPTITEQTDSRSAKRSESACSVRARWIRSANEVGPLTSTGSDSTPAAARAEAHTQDAA